MWMLHTMHETFAGWIIRYSHGVVKYWAMSFLGYSSSALEAKSKALLAAIQCSTCFDYKTIIFESDCEVLIKSLQTQDRDYRKSTICSDIRQWCNQHESFQYRHVHRKANAVANELATRVRPSESDIFFFF